MRDDDFKWDNATSIANDDKHGATFERARLAFSDSFAVGGYDDREDYGEDRYALIGMVEATLLFCCLYRARRPGVHHCCQTSNET